MAAGERIPGPTGAAVDLAWVDTQTLLVLTDRGEERTLWRCVNRGTDCSVLFEDGTDSLRLR